jgi:hypothetical protein
MVSSYTVWTPGGEEGNWQETEKERLGEERRDCTKWK